jgi:hypothetical protein
MAPPTCNADVGDIGDGQASIVQPSAGATVVTSHCLSIVKPVSASVVHLAGLDMR